MSVRALFLRERAGSFYSLVNASPMKTMVSLNATPSNSPLAWLLSRVLFDLIPLRLIPTIIVTTIVYFMVGLNPDAARFFKCLLILVEFSLCLTLFVSLLHRELDRRELNLSWTLLFNRICSWLRSYRTAASLFCYPRCTIST
jgi:hypothetical protein